MSETTPELPANYFGYADLAALKTVHARLIQRQEEIHAQKSSPDELLDAVADFVIRAQATGHVLGTDDDRTAAQNIIDYWVTVLLRGRRTPPETGLAEFRSQTSGESLKNRPVAEYLAEERTTIRRRLGLSAAAAQWNEADRPNALVWGGRQLDDAADYDDLSPLEHEFIAASRRDERRSMLRRRVALYAGLLAAGTIALLVVAKQRAENQALEERRQAEVAHRREAQRLFATKLVERGGFLLGRGDASSALLWFTDALKAAAEADDATKNLHRLRIGTARAQLPKLEHALLEPAASEKKLEFNCANARFSPDGAHILTVSTQKSGGGVARLWEAKTGLRLAEISEPEAQFNDAGFCADGRIFTAEGTRGSGKGRLRFWTRDGQADGEFKDIGGAVLTAVASPDGERLGFSVEGLAEKPSIAEVRQMRDEPLTGQLSWHGDLREVSFSARGEYFVACGSVKGSGADQGQVRVFDAWTGAEVSWEMRTELPVTSAAFAPDGVSLVAGTGVTSGKTGSVEVWEVFTSAPIVAPALPSMANQLFKKEHDGMVSSVCFSPDGKRVLSASYDETARVWDARAGSQLLSFPHESSVFRAAYSPDGRLIVSGGRDQVARVWSVATGKAALPPLGHAGTVAQVRFDPRGDRLLTTSPDGARLWRLCTGEPVSPILKLSEPVWKMAMSSDGARVAAIGKTGAVGAWETATGKAASGEFPIDEGKAAFFSADASMALIAHRHDGPQPAEIVRLYRLSPEPAPGAVLQVSGSLSYAAFSPDGGRVFVACTRAAGGGTAGLYDVATGQLSASPAISATVVHAVFSPDGRYLLTADGTTSPARGEARVWDAATGEEVATPMAHDEEITYAGFNRDLSAVITASVDDTAKIWTLDWIAKTAAEKMAFTEHSADLLRASFSPDGAFAVTASFDRSAILWNLADQKRAALLPHPGVINDAQFSADGRLLVTACSDQVARVWEVATGDPVAVFRHAGDVVRASFSPAGDVVTLSRFEMAPVPREGRTKAEWIAETAARRTMLKAQTWRLTSASGEPEALADFARLVRAKQIENARDLVRLERAAFTGLRKNGDELVREFAADAQAMTSLMAVEDSEATGEWFAAHWHLGELLKAQPKDPALLARRGFASASMLRWKDAMSDYEQAVALHPEARIYSLLAKAALELNRYPEAVEHATKGLAFGENHDLSMMRAEGYAGQQQWAPAAEDLQKAIPRNPQYAAAYERLAAVRLKQNAAAEYSRVCAEMVRHAQADTSVAGTAAWACALRPGAVPDPQVAVDLALLTIANPPARYFDINTLGSVLYRAGDYEGALKRIQESRAAYIQEASLVHAQGLAKAAIMPIQDGRPVDWIFLAMINAKLGNRREAEEWLKRAAKAVDERSITDPRRVWHRMEVELLLEETTALLAQLPR